jgi:hypothetical protein
VAVGPALAPLVEEARQAAWFLNASRLPDVGALANGVSQGQIDSDTAYSWAKRHGFGKDAFGALVNVANTGPGVPAAFDLWRRGIIDQAGFRRAAKRQGLEQEWIDDLVKLRLDVLDPGQLAAAIHRGLIPDPGLLVGEQPQPPFNVAAYPTYDIGALQEALANGYDHDHLGVLVGLQGLPMGTHEAAEAYFKGIITHGDYVRAFNESNSRNEWAGAVLENTRQIPTARDFFENALRGHHSLEWAQDQAKRHGMQPDDALVFWQNQGRAMNPHQITQALAYGANYNPRPGDLPDPYVAAVKLGPLRPEYEELAEALKYTLPSALYFRTLQQSGVLTQTEAETWYLRLGWPPELADKVSKAFAKQKATGAKEATAADILKLWDGGRLTDAQALAELEGLGYPADEAQRKLDTIPAGRAASAKNTAITDLHALFKKSAIDGPTALTALAELGVPDWAANQIVVAWGIALEAAGARLTLENLKADYQAGRITRADAIAGLESLGLTSQAANLFLDT